ncbi:MAG: trehalose-phosphatase, partial [Chloroflexota bacterium]
MQNVLDVSVWNTVAGRLARSYAVLLALDFDGTLAPIVEYPDKAALPSSTASLLKALAEKPGYHVAIVTGRALSDVKRRIRIGGLIYCGNHGLEADIEGRQWKPPGVEEARGAIEEAWKALDKKLKDLQGVMLEDKGLSFSVHYRLAPAEVKQTCLRVCGQ